MEELKNKGNSEFKQNNLLRAIDYYNEALKFNEKKEILFSNISTAYLKLENYEEALNYAQKAIDLEPNYVKVNIQK